MPAFLAKPLVKYGLLVLSGALLILAFIWWLNDQKDDAATKAVADERGKQAVEIVNRMEKADEARREVRDPGSRAKYDSCLRSATNREACQRYMPE
jgi:hypothetical protein